MDFGDEAPLDEPLAVLCESLNHELRLSPNGRFVLQSQLAGSLANRLRLVDLMARRPEVFRAPVARPLFVAGIPRTGTTFVQKLLSQDPHWRTLPLWETRHPLPDGDLTAPPPDPDPRIDRSRRELRMVHRLLPEQAAMHELVHDEPEEEYPLLAGGHCSSMYENAVLVPAYTRWFTGADHRGGYRLFRRYLQFMQWSRPQGERWALKTPGHLEMLVPLLDTFEDATVVHTHRDPVTSVVSLSNMLSYDARTYFDHPDPHLIGRCAADFTERLLRAAIRDRKVAGDRLVDVFFRELISDPVRELRRVYEVADRELDAGTERAMRGFAEAQGRRAGRHRYAAEDFALSVPELRERFAFYYDFFDLTPEKS
ncbi:sulfotransferase [Streptomyces sp. XD-27]|uniref:sulfotransferase family protein n=1 Tax=Streptomyces sp. XD-27 TaxID=3062779 RepID=UPI0026F42CC6|nr:sulfotransferase [Streptomyces sp. XD-27]WKX70708.1 sulfotransferase [Streptomyces sp. XD-27]